MRLRKNNLHLGFVILSDILRESALRPLDPLEEGHFEEVAHALQEIADTVQWLSEGNLKPGNNIPTVVFESYDRAEKLLNLFERRAETVEFIAKAVGELAKRHPLTEAERKRLIPLAAKLEAAFDPFRHHQFERIETL